MKKNLFLLQTILLFLPMRLLFSQDAFKEREKEFRESYIEKTVGVEDRAGGTHNASNIGLFFENRGKLYPRRLTQGPSGEFPIGSAKHYIYRINPIVGIPGNVIQGRFTTNEEWEAVGGYHNRQYAKIAFSDNPSSWHPTLGWPVKDAAGNPIFKSDQDSYCVYDDAKNSVKVLGITVAQTGYAYGVKFAQNMIFFKFEVINKGTQDLDSLYFAMYCDIDVGNVSGGVPEYLDDRIDFDQQNNFLYFFDDGKSDEWPGGVTGYFGVAMLKTPLVDGQELGVTDMHYNLYDDDKDDDTLQYALLCSNPNLVKPASLIPKYFHTGNLGNIHYDDPATIPASGLDIVATISSGPYRLAMGDTLVFYTALIAGNNKDDLFASLKTAQRVLAFDFEISKPPKTPTLSAFAGDGFVTLFWNDIAELSKDNYSGQYDFEGYRIYKSLDKGLHWDQWDRNVDPSVGENPVPIAQFDIINNRGLDTGLQYSYTDTTVENGFEYWYTITAYDRGDESVESLESPRGNSPDAINTVSVIPKSRAAGRTPVASDKVEHIGKGNSNYVLNVQPIDQDSLADREYTVKFTYVQRTIQGTLKTRIIPIITDSSKTEAKRYGIEFISPNAFHLIDLNTGDYIGSDPRNYRSGTTYSLTAGMRIRVEDPDPNAAPEFLPKAGDYLTYNFAVYVIRNNQDTVVAPQPFLLEKQHTTRDGVIFSLVPPEVIQSVSRVGGTDKVTIAFSVVDQTLVKNNTYLITIVAKGFDPNGKGFVSLQITNAAGAATTIDSLYNLDTFEFDGIRGRIEFEPNAPPGPGNAFAVETVVPVMPTIRDAYRFKIKGSTLDPSRVQSELNQIRVVPNPYLVSSLYEPEFGELRREPIRQIQFINLPPQCTIYIFTIAGDRVKTIEHNAAHGTETWDLRSDGGREIASGVYLYIVKTDKAQFKSTFAVIK
ncbi:MAG: hypothetical protein ONB31_06170 [candidate division KSB1 bacterium]|nr:hypothetical protein [candidate division KSB1 bacterium]MDZ7336376.1 hypothetical protein [candidate division KSB1 bacterium]MDZ7358736.1 hypothetical protein [candidate division KSB1 bacterium]MDZ7401981.1 hypothetical protein [candidate division KSB1 bacterium]